MIEFYLLLLGFSIGIGFLFFLLNKSKTEYTKINIRTENIEKERQKLFSENENYKKEKNLWIEESASLKAQNEYLKTELENQKDRYEDKLEEQNKHYEDKIQEKEQNLSSQKNLYEQLEEKSKQLTEKTKSDFKNIANEIFRESTKSYREESTKNLSQILHPFKENMETFKKSIQGFTNKEQFLDETIKNFKDINLKMRDEASKLSQALKGDIKTQGGWGEFVLENILEKSGLRKGEDFFPQAEGLNLKNKEGSSLRPDAVVKLPENKYIIIDSKVSFTHYNEYLSSNTEEQKKNFLIKFLNSVSSHIDNLSSKEYQFAEDIKTAGFILMFIPNEGMFALATQNKKGLFEKAWRQSIIIVSPSTLYATLKTIASIWKIEEQSKNAEKIAKRGQLLYDKFTGFLEDMSKIDASLKTARDSYDEAIEKLSKGKGNLLKQSQQLKQLENKPEKEEKSLEQKSQQFKNSEKKEEKSLIQEAQYIKDLGRIETKKQIPISFETK